MRARLILMALVLLVGAGLGGYWLYQSRNSLHAETPVVNGTSLPIREVQIGGKTFTVELATTTDQETAGLSHRLNLPTGHGMLFQINPPAQSSFWMKDMNFSIDIVWIRNGKIVQISPNLPVPATDIATSNLPNYTPDSVVDYVLEINAGESAGLSVGNTVLIAEPKSI